ncbi:MAG: methyltransferase domain-containing protein [Candidatus Roizmanbacteria bacterium]
MSIQNKKSAEIIKHAQKSFDLWAKNYDQGLTNLFFDFNNKIIINSIPQSNKCINILDIGCGTGNLLINLYKQNQNINLFGIDISEKMVQIAKLKTKNINNIHIKNGAAEDLPFEKEYFDCVVCSNSLHHHPNIQKSLIEMTRVLKKQGKLIIVDGYTNGILRKIIFWFIEKIQNEGVVQRFSKEQMFNLLKKFEYTNIIQKDILFMNLMTVGDKD